MVGAGQVDGGHAVSATWQAQSYLVSQPPSATPGLDISPSALKLEGRRQRRRCRPAIPEPNYKLRVGSARISASAVAPAAISIASSPATGWAAAPDVASWPGHLTSQNVCPARRPTLQGCTECPCLDVIQPVASVLHAGGPAVAVPNHHRRLTHTGHSTPGPRGGCSQRARPSALRPDEHATAHQREWYGEPHVRPVAPLGARPAQELQLALLILGLLHFDRVRLRLCLALARLPCLTQPRDQPWHRNPRVVRRSVAPAQCVPAMVASCACTNCCGLR